MLMAGMNQVHERFDGLDDKIARLKPRNRGYPDEQSQLSEGNQYAQTTPRTQTVNINTQPTGHTMGESMFPAENENTHEDGPRSAGDDEELIDYEEHEAHYPRGVPSHTGDTRTHGPMSDLMSEGRDDSPGQQYLEEELYKLRIKPGGSQAATHKTWELGEVPQDEQEDYHDEEFTDSGLPEIPDGGNYTDNRATSPPLPPIPHENQSDDANSPQSPNQMLVGAYHGDQDPYMPPWQRIHQRLLSWAIIWPMSDIENALNSTTRGHQVDEIALSIW